MRNLMNNENELLLEYGLPHTQLTLILVITFGIIFFIVWSNYVIIDETIKIGGTYIAEDNNRDIYKGYITTEQLGRITKEHDVIIYYEGSSEEDAVHGTIVRIGENAIVSNNNMNFDLYIESSEKLFINNKREGMEVIITIKVGEKSLLQYLMGYLYDAVEI